MALEEYEDYEHSSEDEEEDCSDGSRDSSPSLNEHELTIKQEDDKTTACMTDGAHLPAAEEANVDAKQEIKEEALDGPVIMRLIDPGLDKQEAPTAPVPNAALESAAAGSGTGERTSHSSGVGPDVQTEAKRVSDFRSLESASLYLTRPFPDLAKPQIQTLLNPEIDFTHCTTM